MTTNKRKLSGGVKAALIVGVLLVVIGSGLWIYEHVFDGNIGIRPVDMMDATLDSEQNELSVDRIYTEYFMPNAKNCKIDDQYLDYTLLEAGRLADNEILQTAMSNVGITNNGYYFMMEMVYESEAAYAGIVPFAYLNGHVGDQTMVANTTMYVANSDLTEISLCTDRTVQPGCYYVMIGFVEYDDMDDAQFHFYNNDYEISIIHVSIDSKTIVPYGYMNSADADVVEG